LHTLPFGTKEWRKLLFGLLWKYKWVYMFMIGPALGLVVVFRYLPMPGIFLSFENFRPVFGKNGLYDFLFSSRWVGLTHFKRMVIEPEFHRAFRNTLIISVMKLGIGFPFPVLLALMINEIRQHNYKRFLQTVYTFPHFLSWVVVSGIMLNLLGDSGAIKKIALLVNPGFQTSWTVLYDVKFFRLLLVLLDMWKEAGWGTILYLAAIIGIDQSLYEAATVDGCNRVGKIWHITLPSISGIIVIMFILQMGNIMNVNFNQIFNMYSEPVYVVGDIIDTYIYRLTFQSSTVMDYGFTTAVGLFKTVINFTLLMSANFIARRVGYDGII
jgi:putative aldouronate transport system permease protein